ncbi:MAG TPA: hypothetical protein VLH37_03800, partial [Bacteroidales bacterium]|nr:hypothetical protein [Bacteroidales bacterium]
IGVHLKRIKCQRFYVCHFRPVLKLGSKGKKWEFEGAVFVTGVLRVWNRTRRIWSKKFRRIV